MSGRNEHLVAHLRPKYASFIGFTALVWDHLVTFSDEVEYIWKGRKSIRECHSSLALSDRLTVADSCLPVSYCESPMLG